MKLNGSLAVIVPKFMLAPPADTSPPAKGTPSTTINGPFPPRKVPLPRILIEFEAPGSPLEDVICTPATLPLKSSAGLTAATLSNFFALNKSTAPVASFFLTDP